MSDFETTNREHIDSNQDKPRVIYRGTNTITTDVSVGSFYTGFTSDRFDELKVDAKSLIEVWIKDNQTSRVYKTPVMTINDSNQYDLNCYWYILSEDVSIGGGNFETVQRLVTIVNKRGGSATDTYDLYYLIYSTKINENIVFGKYSS